MVELGDMLARMERKNHENNGLSKRDAISVMSVCYLVSDLLYQSKEYLVNCPEELRARIERWALECADGRE